MRLTVLALALALAVLCHAGSASALLAASGLAPAAGSELVSQPTDQVGGGDPGTLGHRERLGGLEGVAEGYGNTDALVQGGFVASAVTHEETVQPVKEAGAFEIVRKNGHDQKNYAVLLTAKWCTHCPRMYPVVERLRKEGYIVYVLDVDKYADELKRLDIPAGPIPAMLIYKDGKQDERFNGVRSIETIRPFLKTREEQEPDEPAPVSETDPEPQPAPVPAPKPEKVEVSRPKYKLS